MTELTEQEILRRSTNYFNRNICICASCGERKWEATEIQRFPNPESLEIGGRCLSCNKVYYKLFTKRTLRDFQ